MDAVVPAKGSEQLADEAATAKQVIERFNAQLWKRVALMALALLMATGGGFGWAVSKINDLDQTVTTIRTVQKANTVRSDCQLVAFNGILSDIPLAFAGDKNPNDYAKVHKCK